MTATQPNFQYVAHWQTDLPDENEAVLAFWRHEKAIGDDGSAKKAPAAEGKSCCTRARKTAKWPACAPRCR